MILGILSDTHGRARIARVAIQALIDANATYFVHCGDVGDGVLRAMPAGRSAFVLGNNDYDADAMAVEALTYDVTYLGYGGRLDLDGVCIGVAHGDVPSELRALRGLPELRCLLTGHSHVPHDRHEGDVRLINPGALCRAATKTVATLDLATDDLRFLTIAE